MHFELFIPLGITALLALVVGLVMINVDEARARRARDGNAQGTRLNGRAPRRAPSQAGVRRR